VGIQGETHARSLPMSLPWGANGLLGWVSWCALK